MDLFERSSRRSDRFPQRGQKGEPSEPSDDDVLPDAQVRQQAEVLMDEAQSAARAAQLCRREFLQVSPVDPDMTSGGANGAGGQAECRGLPRTAGTDEGDRFADSDREAGFREGPRVLEIDGDVQQFESSGGRRRFYRMNSRSNAI